MASLKPLQQIHQLQFLSFTHCKYSSTLNPFKFPNKNISAHAPHLETTLSNSDTNQVLSRNTNLEKRVILKDRYAKDKFNFKTKRNNGSGKISKNKDKDKRPFIEKGSRRTKVEGPGNTLRIGLDSCSKMGDVISAIKLYDLAMKEGVKMGQHHYAVLLYLCSSAATGFVQPAKSGSGGRSLNSVANSSESLIESEKKLSVNGLVKHYPKNLDGLGRLMKKSADNLKRNEAGDLLGCNEIQVSEEVKKFALQKGLEIYEKMRLENVVMNEATFTSVARMAMSINNGDMAFNIVKQMQELGINPKLRSYGPALTVYCSNNEVEKAFLVEQDMLKNGVFPEEPELEALLRVSVESGRSERVYYLLHKLRISVRQVSEGTANVIEKWFMSKAGLKVGKRKWDEDLIVKASENNGGGWHGLGWLGKGKWNVSRTLIGSDGLCKCCGDKLVTIDLDPVETENFAKSVASIANQREKNSSFQKFQKWLDYYGPFDAVVDGANVGLYSQRGFKPTKVNAVVNGIRQMLPSKKWPLIILHNRRIIGDKMDEPVNKTLVEKWKTADALYLTPTGSNDDWYWLYAAIKFKSLLVTNDEMRDHLFQLLGTDFFPKWKERHQVHFSFSEIGPVFRMPPPCSVVIQESEKGHWHVPIKSESESEEERAWLCVNRAPHVSFDNKTEANMTREKRTEHSKSDSHMKTKTKTQAKLTPRKRSEKKDTKKEAKNEAHEMYRNLKSILSPSHPKILSEIESAEKLSGCLIDFQI